MLCVSIYYSNATLNKILVDSIGIVTRRRRQLFGTQVQHKYMPVQSFSICDPE